MEPVNCDSMLKLNKEVLFAVFNNNTRKLFADEVFSAIRAIPFRGASSYQLRRKMIWESMCPLCRTAFFGKLLIPVVEK